MTNSFLAVDRPADHVCRILINRPDKLNAINFEVRDEMQKVLPDIMADDSVRVMILGGVGGNLSAGGDVPSMQGLSKIAARERLEHIHKLCHIVANADIPIVTAAEGICAGGAVGLALLGDFIIGDESTKILVPFLKLGLAPDWGMMRSLPQRVGIARARRMVFEAETLKAELAQEIGLLDFLAVSESAMALAIRKAERLATRPRHAVALVKERFRQMRSFENDLAVEIEHQVQGLTGAEFQEGFAAYTEKRNACFTDI